MKFFDTHGLLYKKKDVYFKHSSGEQFTGRYWIDGKKIYTKTLTTTVNSFAHNISNLSQVVSISAIYYRGNTYGRSDGSNDVTVQNSNIYLTGDIASYVSNTAYITIEYTCTDR